MLVLRGVHVHERKSHISLWHDERPCGLEPDSVLTEVALKNVYGAANVVAGRAEGIGIVVFVGMYKAQMLDKQAVEHGWPPAVYGKAETYAFLFSERINFRGGLGLGNVDKPFACSFGYLADSPERVACTGKIEYHVANLHK